MQSSHDSRMMNDTIQILEQALELLHRLDDETYMRILPPVFQNSVGSHVRHCLDFYTAFLNGIHARRIDYDERERDESIERNREAAIARIETTIHRMRALDFLNEGMSVAVRLEDESENQEAWSRSSIGREVQALKSHTIHHYALIALMLRLQGIAVSDDFGVSTSTLRRRRAA